MATRQQRARVAVPRRGPDREKNLCRGAYNLHFRSHTVGTIPRGEDDEDGGLPRSSLAPQRTYSQVFDFSAPGRPERGVIRCPEQVPDVLFQPGTIGVKELLRVAERGPTRLLRNRSWNVALMRSTRGQSAPLSSSKSLSPLPLAPFILSRCRALCPWRGTIPCTYGAPRSQRLFSALQRTSAHVRALSLVDVERSFEGTPLSAIPEDISDNVYQERGIVKSGDTEV